MRKYLILLLVLTLLLTGSVAQAAEPQDDVFTFYMMGFSVDFRTISIAPAGTEDWQRIEFVAQCGNSLWGHQERWIAQYQIPYSGEECTLWDVKLELLPDEESVKSLYPDAEYSCTIWRNLTLKDGESVLRYYSAYNSAMVIVEPVVFCEDCYEVFGLEPEQEVE